MMIYNCTILQAVKILTLTYSQSLIQLHWQKLSGTIFFTMYKEAIADKINNNQVYNEQLHDKTVMYYWTMK